METKTVKEAQEYLDTLAYPNGDRLSLNVNYISESNRWAGSVTSIQPRGGDFIGTPTPKWRYYADSPEEAAWKAVTEVLRNWAFEPNTWNVVIKKKGNGVTEWLCKGIPVKR